VNRKHAIRLLGPITVGSALAGYSLLLRGDGDQPEREEDEGGASFAVVLGDDLAGEEGEAGRARRQGDGQPLAFPAAHRSVLAGPVTPSGAMPLDLAPSAVPELTLKSPVVEAPAPAASLAAATTSAPPRIAGGDAPGGAGMAPALAVRQDDLAPVRLAMGDESAVLPPGPAGMDGAGETTGAMPAGTVPQDPSAPGMALVPDPIGIAAPAALSADVGSGAAPSPAVSAALPLPPASPAENVALVRIEDPGRAAAPSPAAGAAPDREVARLSPARRTFPESAAAEAFTYDDELILQLRIAGVASSDTLLAYGTRDGIYLPLGELARILDLAVRISDDGHYASGWFLSEDRTLTIDLRQGRIVTAEGEWELPPGLAQAFEGELFLRSDAFADLLPLRVEPDLRAQAVLLTTLEPFPFEERLQREADRERLAARGGGGEPERWPREETPWQPLSVPMADAELRAVSDSTKGTRAEGDLRLAGDLAWMTAQAYFSATTRDGLVASLVELGRRDADGDLLGPLQATEFQLGDVSTLAMPLGLRGAAGRGGFITNQQFQSASVFDQLDLRGVLPDGYEVELYRNDVLFGSTRSAVNGQYEFLEVPVDYGLNVFRLVFYGPQGQRYEEVRQVSVGDGRLAAGALEYSFGAVQRGINLLGVEGPDFVPLEGYGDWQAVGELTYGISSAVTGLASAAFYQEDGRERWLAGAGLRSGLGSYAIRADVGVDDASGHAFGFGLGGRALGGAFTLSHFEYGGGFVDEVHSLSREPVRRVTEGDFNASLRLGGEGQGAALPLSLRARYVEFEDGRSQSRAALRASARLPGAIVSNTFEFQHNSAPGLEDFTQLFGNFDLASFNRSRTQLRGSLGYQLAPELELTHVAGEVNHALDERTMLRASAAYAFANDDISFGLSASREFERFTLAFDSQYAPERDSYYVALRLGLSFGRDPLRRNLFVEGPGRASSGAIALRAFQDLDGDNRFGPGDQALPGVDFAVSNGTATTDEQGFVRLGELSNGNRVSVQVDPATLPDIMLAPVSRGIEIVPRAGRIHTTEFPIVALSEVEGMVRFSEDAGERGVSGLRLGLADEEGEVGDFVRTERGGYYFFERVKPGDYMLIIDPAQAERLGLCLSGEVAITVGSTGNIYTRDIEVARCD